MKNAYDFIMNELNLKYQDSIVIAVSGGPDSMALLNLSLKVRKALDINIVCAHVNHNIRKESVKERKFVEKYCAKNNIVFESMIIEEYGDDNFHNEARVKRYNYFYEIVQKYHAKYLFTAHHGDDLIETILMRIVRGSTLKGYSGFSEIVDMGNYKIARPLIKTTKSEIMNYLMANNVKYVKDSSNDKDVYTRNRFRKYLLPPLKKEDIKVNQKFYKFSKTLLEYNNFIDKQVNGIISNIYINNILDIEKLKQQEKLIQMKIIYYMLEKLYQDDLMLITDHHAELIYDLIHSQKANSEIYLPNEVKAIKAYNDFYLMVDENANNVYEIELLDYMNLPNGKNLKIEKTSMDDSNFTCRLSSKELTLPLRVRTRQDGDKMHIKGMVGNKKINDIFIDSKIPIAERDVWPIVVDSKNQIVWLPGLKKSKHCKTKLENYDIIIKYY